MDGGGQLLDECRSELVRLDRLQLGNGDGANGWGDHPDVGLGHGREVDGRRVRHQQRDLRQGSNRGRRHHGLGDLALLCEGVEVLGGRGLVGAVGAPLELAAALLGESEGGDREAALALPIDDVDGSGGLLGAVLAPLRGLPGLPWHGK